MRPGTSPGIRRAAESIGLYLIGSLSDVIDIGGLSSDLARDILSSGQFINVAQAPILDIRREIGPRRVSLKK